MQLLFTTAGAIAESRAGRLEDWVHAFLSAEGGNPGLSVGLRLEARRYHGPVVLAVGLLERCAGPEASMGFRVSSESFFARVERLAAAIAGGQDLPPPFVNFRAGRPLVVNDGNHRLEALRRLDRVGCPAIVWTTGGADAAAFEAWWQERSIT